MSGIKILGVIKSFFVDAGWFANFCTILLFVVFIVGKIWILWRNRSIYSDNIEYISCTGEQEQYGTEYILDEDGHDILKIYSPEGIYDLTAYETKITKHGKLKKGKRIEKKYKENMQHPLKLNKNEPVYIRINLSCGAPHYMIEIKKYDYSILAAAIGYDGRDGGVLLTDKKVKRNLRSWLYYLCQ